VWNNAGNLAVGIGKFPVDGTVMFSMLQLINPTYIVCTTQLLHLSLSSITIIFQLNCVGTVDSEIQGHPYTSYFKIILVIGLLNQYLAYTKTESILVFKLFNR